MLLERYIPPNLRGPLRDAGNIGYSILDNVIGIEDGYRSAGERFKDELFENPKGVAKQIGSGMLEGAKGLLSDPVGTARDVITDVAQSTGRAAKGAAGYLPEGVELKSATMEQIRAANDAYTGDLVAMTGVIPAASGTRAVARAAGNVDVGARTADAIGLGRSIASGDLEGIGEVFQRSGEANSLSAAKVGSDYFDPPAQNAGRALDPAMKSPFSLNVKQKTAPYNWSTGARDLGILAPTTLIRPEDDLGKRLYFAAGDRTSGGQEITSIGEMQLRRPVVMMAGPEFMNTGDTWASHRGVMKPKDNVLQQVSQNEEVKLAYMPMGERSGDFAKHQAELFSEALYSAPMPDATVRRLDDELRKIIVASNSKQLDRRNKARAKKGLPPQGGIDQGLVPSVSSPVFRDWFSSQAAESIRKPFIQRVDKADVKNLDGNIDVGEIRFAATNPDLVNAQSFSAGYRFGTPDIQRGLLDADHPSYDTKYAAVEGTGAETYGMSVPPSIMARDTFLPRLAESAKGQGYRFGQNDFPERDYLLPADQRVFTMNPKTSQLIDGQLVEEANKFMELSRTLGPEYADMYNRGLIADFIRGY